MEPIPVKNGYSLQFSNGNRWSILYSSNSAITIEKMAEIMGLSPLNNAGNKLIFIRDRLKNGTLQFDGINGLNLPVEGWNTTIIDRISLLTHPDVPDIVCDLGPEGDTLVELFKIMNSIFAFYQHELKIGGLPVHSALVEHDHQGVLLAARGSTGKSTCCHRIPEPWHALCDDEALVVRSSESEYAVHPFPTWSNFLFDRPKKSWDVQYHVPLKAIFFLEQSPNDEVVPIKHGEATSRLYYSADQVYHRMLVKADPEFKALIQKQLFDNACEMSRHIPSYVLKVSLDGKFWEEIDKVLPTI